MDKYKTMVETHEHKQMVSKLINNIIVELMVRARTHDDSKLGDYEVDIFTKYTPKLAESTYGSEEYKQFLSEMKPALDHHYANNRHHPEYHKSGIQSMDLVDIIEMLCDWKAATLRHNDGDIDKSLDINQKRFGYSDTFKEQMRSTLKYLD